MIPHARPASPRQDDRVERWRQRTLTAAGFDEGLARQLAARRAVDVHALLELVDRGCAPHLAARILAPLNGGDA